jgi:ribosomal-protein-alanine N-acetyltransferase
MAWHETAALTAGISTIYIEARASNAGTRAFYRQLGYSEVQVMRGYYEGIEDAVRLAKDLWAAARPS